MYLPPLTEVHRDLALACQRWAAKRVINSGHMLALLANSVKKFPQIAVGAAIAALAAGRSGPGLPLAGLFLRRLLGSWATPAGGSGSLGLFRVRLRHGQAELFGLGHAKRNEVAVARDPRFI